jgi:prephenate dehydrogenase
LEIGAIDQAATDLLQAVNDCDSVILCTPVGLFAQILAEIAPALRPGTIVTDVGSTKRSVVEIGERLLPKGVPFVGSHPMAGSEKRGIEFARADLFQNALCILTPTPRTDAQALGAVESFWQTLGMRLTRLSPEEHDRLLADVSHLPHVIAAALIAMQEESALALAGKGFLDATRIAGGDGGLWRDILLDNRDNLLASLGKLKAHLHELEGMLQPDQAEQLVAWLSRSATRREELVKRKLSEIDPD